MDRSTMIIYLILTKTKRMYSFDILMEYFWKENKLSEFCVVLISFCVNATDDLKNMTTV